MLVIPADILSFFGNSKCTPLGTSNLHSPPLYIAWGGILSGGGGGDRNVCNGKGKGISGRQHSIKGTKENKLSFNSQ